MAACALALAVSASAQQAARNACFVRVAALRTIPGLATAVPAGETLNAGPADRAKLADYDTALAGAIDRFGGGGDIAGRLLDTEPLVVRIAECRTQLALPENAAPLAAAALARAFEQNIAAFPLNPPAGIADPAQRRLQERIMASAYVAKAAAARGLGGERSAAAAQQVALVAAARAEAEARWEAGRPQREAEERARQAAADAYARRQRTAEGTPDKDLVLRAIMTELYEVQGDSSAVASARALAEFTDRPGERSGLGVTFIPGSGRYSLRFGSGEYAMVQHFLLWIDDPACQRLSTGTVAWRCSFQAEATVQMDLAGENIIDSQSGRKPVTTPIVWNGQRWSAPVVRNAMIENLRRTAVKPSSTGLISIDKGLCRSLGAGVVAAGGRSTSAALDPQTWGC